MGHKTVAPWEKEGEHLNKLGLEEVGRLRDNGSPETRRAIDILLNLVNFHASDQRWKDSISKEKSLGREALANLHKQQAQQALRELKRLLELGGKPGREPPSPFL